MSFPSKGMAESKEDGGIHCKAGKIPTLERIRYCQIKVSKNLIFLFFLNHSKRCIFSITSVCK